MFATLQTRLLHICIIVYIQPSPLEDCCSIQQHETQCRSINFCNHHCIAINAIYIIIIIINIFIWTIFPNKLPIKQVNTFVCCTRRGTGFIAEIQTIKRISSNPFVFARSGVNAKSESIHTYWVPQKLPQIYTVIAYICTGKVA